MSGSIWNAWSERKLGAKLGVEEWRLAETLGRNIIGWGNGELGEHVDADGVRWRTKEKALGRELLRGDANLHGLSFERACAGLEAKKLLLRQGGGKGAGNATTYVLLLEVVENAADERPFTPAENAAENAAEKAAEERRRIDAVGSEDPPNPPQAGGTTSKRSLRELGTNPRAVKKAEATREAARWLARNVGHQLREADLRTDLEKAGIEQGEINQLLADVRLRRDAEQPQLDGMPRRAKPETAP